MSVPVAQLILDLDGTLVDSLPGIEYSIRAAMEARGLAPYAGEMRPLIGPPVREILRQASGLPDAGELDRLLAEFRAVYDGGGWSRAALYPEVKETLETLSLHGCRFFVLTNKPHRAAEKLLAHLGIQPLMTSLYSPDRPEAAFSHKVGGALALMSDFRLDPRQTLLVGDSLDDAHAAFTLGCKFAAVGFGYGDACTQEVHPVHFRLRRFGELISIITPAGSGPKPDSAILSLL